MNPSKELQHLATMKKSHILPLKSMDEDGIPTKYITEISYYDYKLKNVMRLSTVPTHRPYTVAIHSYYTALLYIEICECEKQWIDQQNLMWVLRHDVVEAVTGDLIYPVKNKNGTTQMSWENIEWMMTKDTILESFTEGNSSRKFSKEAWNIFKCADLYELFLFCTEEYELGNRHIGIIKVLRNCLTYIPDFGIESVNAALNAWQDINRLV